MEYFAQTAKDNETQPVGHLVDGGVVKMVFENNTRSNKGNANLKSERTSCSIRLENHGNSKWVSL